ncbi:UDP-N-acetylmuramate dehydrogenase [Candidatus Curculioniphilus buchneri]|uniref:UDP-N-acetylmuramate dehydrogenase n=1 Tax=Candidatus Curculioniphilus buchneri TaxID=690594 RepID=UPI00376ED76C
MRNSSVALKLLNTFAIDVRARSIVTAHSESELLKLWWKASERNQPILVLGGGSNVLFLENYLGTVLLNRINGIKISEDTEAWYVHVNAGEIWHNLVNICLDRRMPGLENLAMIPGYVGSAPIQNIGAYGVELKQVCEYVDIIQLETGTKIRLSAVDCQFGYRESIFKHDLREHNVIVSVCLRLTKDWKPVLNYGDLTRFNAQQVTPRQIYEMVCKMRRNKLPDPTLVGNAGSFFKNPIIDSSEAKDLLHRYPDVPYYPQLDGRVKLAAGWLIDHCGLKGYKLGGAALHDEQALILINTGKANGSDIVSLARYIRRKIADQFSIWLEPEVRFISALGEVDAKGVVS